MRIYNKVDQMEDRISELQDRKFYITQSRRTKEKEMKRSKDSLHNLWYFNDTNSRIIRFPEGEERENEDRKLI